MSWLKWDGMWRLFYPLFSYSGQNEDAFRRSAGNMKTTPRDKVIRYCWRICSLTRYKSGKKIYILRWRRSERRRRSESTNRKLMTTFRVFVKALWFYSNIHIAEGGQCKMWAFSRFISSRCSSSLLTQFCCLVHVQKIFFWIIDSLRGYGNELFSKTFTDFYRPFIFYLHKYRITSSNVYIYNVTMSVLWVASFSFKLHLLLLMSEVHLWRGK